MKRTSAVGLLLALLAPGAGAPLRAAPAADTNIVDPDIVKASADADAAAGTPVTIARDDTPQSTQTPYEKALLNYKAGKYDAARALIDEADQETPGNVPVEMLKVRILGELGEFKAAHGVLNSLYDRSDLTPAYAADLELATGDLNLRERKFEPASKAYENFLQTHPNDADAKLKLIYTRLGVGDMVTAGKLESELKPADPASPAYYFARAALIRSGAESGDEEQDFEQARTIYGITITNRYLKTFLEVFSPEKHAANGAGNAGAGTTKPAPSGKAQ